MNRQQGWGPGAFSSYQQPSNSWSQNQNQSLSSFNQGSNSNKSNDNYGANNHNSHNQYNPPSNKFQSYSSVNKAPYAQVNFLPGGYNNQQGGYNQNQGNNWNANK